MTEVAFKENPDAKDCHQCGKNFFIDAETQTAHHIDEEGDIDHDADADHVPYSLDDADGPLH
jgi:hypothetical protein